MTKKREESRERSREQGGRTEENEEGEDEEEEESFAVSCSEDLFRASNYVKKNYFKDGKRLNGLAVVVVGPPVGLG